LIPKTPFGGFGSETATWIQEWFKNPLELQESSRYFSFFKAEAKGVVIEIFVKYPGGAT
jgi:hypothetical protein